MGWSGKRGLGKINLLFEPCSLFHACKTSQAYSESGTGSDEPGVFTSLSKWISLLGLRWRPGHRRPMGSLCRPHRTGSRARPPARARPSVATRVPPFLKLPTSSFFLVSPEMRAPLRPRGPDPSPAGPESAGVMPLLHVEGLHQIAKSASRAFRASATCPACLVPESRGCTLLPSSFLCRLLCLPVSAVSVPVCPYLC